MRKANEKLLHGVAECSAQVRLVQSTVIPSLRGWVVEAQVESDDYHDSELLFQPEHSVLERFGV